MDNSNTRDEIVKFSYDIVKGSYIKDVYYEGETERAIEFKKKPDNRYCWIPKSLIQKRWKKDKNVPQNIYITSYLAFLRIYWEKNEDIS